MDIEGPDAEQMLEYLSVAKIGGNTPIGKVIYTNFLDEDGGVHADLTISRLAENKYRIVTGGADGNRDWVLLRNYRDDNSLDVSINIRTHDIATLGLWGPEAEAVLGNAHGNSLRALIMELDLISSEDIVKLEIPTGAPIQYEFNQNGEVVNKTKLYEE